MSNEFYANLQLAVKTEEVDNKELFNFRKPLKLEVEAVKQPVIKGVLQDSSTWAII